MKVQQASRGRGRDDVKTYLLIPRRIEDDMRLKAGSVAYARIIMPRTMILSLEPAYDTDMPLVLSRYRTKVYNGEAYYSLRFAIPAAFARRLGIEAGMDADMYPNGGRLHVSFRTC